MKSFSAKIFDFSPGESLKASTALEIYSVKP